VEVSRRVVYGGPRRFRKQLRLRQLGQTVQPAFMERWYGQGSSRFPLHICGVKPTVF